MKDRKIVSVFYNFHQCGNTQDGFDGDGDFDKIGRKKSNGCTPIEIKEHIPSNGLQRHYVDIFYDNGTAKRVFNINEIDYGKPEETNSF